MNLQDVITRLDLIGAALNAYKVEKVSSVVRRQFTRRDGTDVEVIDLYPPWNAAGTFGEMKVAHEYMDEDWQRQRFEQFAGVRIADLPVYRAKQALLRTFGQEHPHEIPVQPFQLMLKPQPVVDGNDKKTLIIRYLALPQRRESANGRSQPPPPPPNGNGNGRTTPPVPPRPSNKAPEEWLAEACQAGTSFDFDLCVSKGLPDFFHDANRVESAREGMFGPWQAAHAAAYVAGLRKYREVRTELERQGKPTTAAHKYAKSKAMRVYHQARQKSEAIPQ